MKKLEWLHYGSIASLLALMVLCIAWEGWLAPVRPGGSAVVLKALPLLLPWFGIVRGKVYTYQWSSMLILLYFAEGMTRAFTDHGLAAWLAGGEMVLALLFYFCAIFYVRAATAR
ncbi:MAG: DUF2069 domain-containing protein [Sulfuricella sp.]|nr:DUF2069 domain-containing protein [Sulfuricella sp.]